MSEATEPVKEEEKPPTQTELDYVKAKKIVEPLARNGKSVDDAGKALIMADFTFAKAKRLSQVIYEELGILLSTRNRFELASAILVKGNFAPKTWEDVSKACNYIAQELDVTSPNQALKSIKRFCREQNIELPEKPKGVRGRSPNSFRAISLIWMKENCDKSMDDFIKYMKEAGKDTESNRRYFCRIFDAIQNAYVQGFEAATE